MGIGTKFTHADLQAMPEDNRRREILDRGPKLKAYARFGVSEYWIVDPEERAIELYRLDREGYAAPRIFREPESLTSVLLPGFALPVGQVFV